MPPKVSVVISAYQKARFLPSTLQSVLDQTFQEFEVIVVDDGSTDDTSAIVEAYARKDSRVAYIHQENRGPGSARNTGIRASAADLVALLDGDDLWLPDKLEHQVRAMEAFPNIDLLLMDSRFVSTADAKQRIEVANYYRDYILRHFSPRPLDGQDGVYLIGGAAFAAKLLLKNVFNLSTAVLRKRAWSAVGGFDEDFRGPEDLDFWVRAALNHCQFAYSTHVGAVYQKNEGSLVQASERSYLEQLRHALHAHASPQYEPIRDATQTLVHKRFRQLAVFYTHERQSRKAWRMFRHSVPFGVSVRTMLIALASFLGPVPLDVYHRARRSSDGRI